MVGQRSRGLTAAGVAAGLLVLVWAAVTGPVALVGSAGRPREPPTASLPSATPSADPPPAGARELFRDVDPTLDLSWLGDLVTWLLVLAVVTAVGYALRWLWVRRWRPGPAPTKADFDALPEIDDVADELARAARTHLAAIDEGAPRNGIVRCWARLEESISAAGMPRQQWETSAEFVVRILGRLDLDPRSVAELARLYREARFSEHDLGEPERAAARAALARLHHDLDRT